VVVLVIAAVAGSSWWAAVAHHGSRHSVSDYAAGKTVDTYVSKVGHFRAAFPTTPSRSTEPLSLLGGLRTVLMQGWNSGSDRNHFVVRVFKRPPHTIYDFGLVVRAMAARVDGWVLRSNRVTFDRQPAVKFAIRSRANGFIEGLIVAAPHRIYIVGVDGPDDPRVAFKRFERSFAITS
jgi:hypothetical protein